MSACSTGLVADLTCSLCLNLYDVPKMMPNCPHTFCLDCLKQLHVESTAYPAAILCPECRSVNYIGRDGIDGFSTNIVVQNVARKVQEARKLSKEADICPHRLLLDEHCQTCRHCQKEFCQSCKYRHIEKIKEEIIGMSKEFCETIPSEPIEHLIRKVEAKMHADVEIVEAKLLCVSDALLHAVEVAISVKMSAAFAGLKQLADGEMAKLHKLAEQVIPGHVADAALLSQRQQLLVSVSVFKQELDNAAQLYLDIAERQKILKSIEQISASVESSLVVFRPSSDCFNEIAEKLFDSIQFGSLSVNEAAVEGGCSMTSLSETMSFSTFTNVATQTEPMPLDEVGAHQTPCSSLNQPIDSSSSTTAPPTPTPVPSSIHPTTGNNFQVAAQPSETFFKNAVKVAVTCPVIRLTAFPTKGLFAVVHHQHNKITMFHPNGKLAETYSVQCPRNVQRMEIDDVSTDCRNTIFVTATVRCDGRISRRIYRFWTNEPQPTSPTLFATAETRHGANAFRGLAISAEFLLVVTTEGDQLVAFESINTPRGELGRRVFYSSLGPSPYIHSLNNFNDNSLKIVCSIDGQLLTRTLKIGSVSNNPRNDDTVWQEEGGKNRARINNPAGVCCWDENALVAKSGFLIEYGNTTSNPAVVRTLPASFCPSDVGGIAAMSLLERGVVTTYLAVAHSLSDTVTFLKMITS